MTDIQHQQLLTELLDEIARADLQVDPPQGMEERVLKYWDRNATVRATRIRRKPRAHVRLVPGIGVLVAAVLLSVVVNRSSRGPTASPVPVAPAEAPAQPTAVAEASAPAATSPAVPPRPIATARRELEKRPQHAAPPSEIVSFVSLSPDMRQDLLGSFQVARVLLPREALADLGVVLDANRVGEPIQADVVFGEDGLARAIRLAPQESRRFP
jgi:hypothetical protein